MLTAIVWGVEAPRPFASTLATLVPAAVDGALREVVVVGDLGNAESRRVADHAGCRLEGQAAPASQIREFKGAWILVLRGGDRMAPNWLDVVAEHATERERPARLPIQRMAWPAWRRWIGWQPTACLVPRSAIERSVAASWAELAAATRGPTLRVRPRQND